MSQPIFDQVKSIADQYGVPSGVWYPIMVAESNGNPSAVGDNGKSIGLFQLNTAGGQGSGYAPATLYDPVVNARIAMPAIAEAYYAVKGKYTGAELTAQVAARSGHPGGSISNPLSPSNTGVSRIREIASSYFLGQSVTKGITDQLGLTSPLSNAGVANPLDPISNFIQSIQKADWTAVLIVGFGLVLVVISLALLAVESGMKVAQNPTVQTVAKTAAVAAA